MAVVGWKSPVTGTVSITGGVASLDPHGGGGIRYYIQDGAKTLLARAIADGGKARFPALQVLVTTGRYLYFLIGPPVTGLGYNSTSLQLTIASASGAQSSVASSLVTPTEAFGSLGHDVAVVAVAGAATLFVAFPAQLFNHTFTENYDEIVGFLPRRLPRLSRAAKSVGKSFGKFRSHARLALVVLVGAYLAALLDPSFGVSWKSLETYLGMVCALVVSVALSAFVASTYRRRRKRPSEFVLKALPAGLLIAGLCVIVSRLTRFEPGYLYGVVAGVAFVKELPDREEAHTAALSVGATLVVATLAWLAWDLVNPHATHTGGDALLVVVDDMLAAIFAGGLTGTVISLLPLRFLPGGRIAAWHKGIWSGIFLAAVTGLTGVLLWPRRDSHAGTAPITTIVVLFVVFGGVSVAFWQFFERRKTAKERSSAKEGGPPGVVEDGQDRGRSNISTPP
jgi:hypothetical protein